MDTTTPPTIPDPIDRPTLTVTETAAAYGISRNSCYAAIAAGEIPSIRVGRRLVVPTAAVRRALALDAPVETRAS